MKTQQIPLIRIRHANSIFRMLIETNKPVLGPLNENSPACNELFICYFEANIANQTLLDKIFLYTKCLSVKKPINIRGVFGKHVAWSVISVPEWKT